MKSNLFSTVTFRLALGYGALVIGAMVATSIVLYFGTVGVIDRNIDSKIKAISERLTNQYETQGITGVQREIEQLLTDGVDQDTEIYLLVDARGRTIAGNLSAWDRRNVVLEQLTEAHVTRGGKPSTGRLLLRRFPSGDLLVVGRDMQDVLEIETLVFRSLLGGGAITLILAIGGAFLFRRQLEYRIATIRHTAMEIEAGNLSRRIPVLDAEDEFTRLGREINHMLDRIQQLVDGVRDVSNAIAHDLRTSLGRIRSQLDEALHSGTTIEQLRETAGTAISGIDDLIVVFDKLLQIAEAESGARRQSFVPIALREVITDVVELYDAAAEAKGIKLVINIEDEPTVLGDKALLGNAIANLLDNALKYAGNAATVWVRAMADTTAVSIVIQDNGPGIPAAEKPKVTTRFYRLDRSRSLPGNGLGLSIVTAISQLHEGRLLLEDASPGLIARIVLPRMEDASLFMH